MMGVYIKGMEVPKDNCEAIQQITITNNWIDGEIKMLAHDSVTNEFIGEVVEIPEPHGRLVDASILWAVIDDLESRNIYVNTTSSNRIKRVVRELPTVIEAEK